MNSFWNCSITVILRKWTRKLSYQWGLVDVFIFPTGATIQMIVAKFTPKSSKLAFGTCTAWPISENDSGKLFTIFLFFLLFDTMTNFRLGKSCSGIFPCDLFFPWHKSNKGCRRFVLFLRRNCEKNGLETSAMTALVFRVYFNFCSARIDFQFLEIF